MMNLMIQLCIDAAQFTNKVIRHLRTSSPRLKKHLYKNKIVYIKAKKARNKLIEHLICKMKLSKMKWLINPKKSSKCTLSNKLKLPIFKFLKIQVNNRAPTSQ